MKARVIAFVALALALAVAVPATLATTGPNPAPARTVIDSSTTLAGPLTGAAPTAAGPGGCCV